MAIDPMKGAGSAPLDNRRTDAAVRSESASQNSIRKTNGSDGTDQLDLSATAASLPAGDAVPSGTLSSEQLKSVAARLASGEYNSGAGIDRLAGKLLDTRGILDGVS